jgi:hypothetical protein
MERSAKVERLGGGECTIVQCVQAKGKKAKKFDGMNEQGSQSRDACLVLSLRCGERQHRE